MTMNRRQFLSAGAVAAAAIPLTGLAARAPTATPAGGADFKLCVFSKHLQFLDYPAMAEAAAEAGFDGVDLAVRPGGHVVPERARTDLPAAVEAVNRAGLKAYMMTTAIRGPQEPHTETLLQLGDALDIRTYRMGYLGYDEDKGVAGTLHGLRTQMNGLAALNAKYRVRGGYQNHAGTRIGGPVWDLWELLRETDPAWLGVQYDIRHAVVEGATAWPVGLRLLRDRIHTLVFKDFYWAESGGRWRVKNCPLGDGVVDWPTYLGMVKELGIAGPVSMHFEYDIHDKDAPVARKREECIRAMRRDIQTARRLLADAELG